MTRRIISGSVLFAALVVFLISGGILLKTGVLFCALIGIWEFYKAVCGKWKKIFLAGIISSCAYVLGIEFIFLNYMTFFLSLFLLSILFFLIKYHREYTIFDGAVTFFGFFYVCYFMSYVYLTRELPMGRFYVWLIFICAWGCDTGAYFTGTAIGKRKLCPLLSPKKTVEGSFGGIITSALLSFCYSLLYLQIYEINNKELIINAVSIGVAGSVFSQLGDLAASSIKRFTKIKDYGSIIPGHGGILDRFDSVLFTAPIVYYICYFSKGVL